MRRSISLMLLVVLATATALFGSGEILPKPISAELPTYPNGREWLVLRVASNCGLCSMLRERLAKRGHLRKCPATRRRTAQPEDLEIQSRQQQSQRQVRD